MTETDPRPLERWIQKYPELFRQLDSVCLRRSQRSVAIAMGLGSRVALDREIRLRGLPAYRLIREWYGLIQLRSLDESLAAWCLHHGVYPSIFYRQVQRVAGIPWRELRAIPQVRLEERIAAIWAAAAPPPSAELGGQSSLSQPGRVVGEERQMRSLSRSV